VKLGLARLSSWSSQIHRADQAVGYCNVVNMFVRVLADCTVGTVCKSLPYCTIVRLKTAKKCVYLRKCEL
jgi:hypothetical protein